MHLIISLSALLVSVLLVQIGSGSLGPLDALSGLALGFSSAEIGYLGSSHFIGFFLGCMFGPYIVVRSGHARAFAVCAAAATIAILLHPLLSSVWFWCLLRVLIGFSVACSYTVIESWLQSKLSNSNRGTVFSMYRTVDLVGMLVSQLVIAGLEPAVYVSYNLLAVIACLSLMPLALTQATLPALPKSPKFQPLFVFSISPLAAFGVVVVGITSSSFRMVAPVYASQSGLEQSDIALFLALSVLGGLAAQLPTGILADRLNRRATLTGFSILSILVCGLISSDPVETVFGVPFVFVGGFLFGFATFPIYSVCASHASDFAEKEDMLALSASLIFFFATGAVLAPTFAGYLMDVFGPSAMFTLILVAHVCLLAYTLWRSMQRPVNEVPRPYRYMPRTSMYIAEWARRRTQSPSQAEDGVNGKGK